MTSHDPEVVSAQPHNAEMQHSAIQENKAAKRERGKHQQFESLEGNISPAAVQPINQPNQESQLEPNGETLRHCFPLRLPNLSIWSPNKRQRSSDHQTDFFFDKGSLDRPKTALLFIPSLPLCNNPPSCSHSSNLPQGKLEKPPSGHT